MYLLTTPFQVLELLGKEQFIYQVHKNETAIAEG